MQFTKNNKREFLNILTCIALKKVSSPTRGDAKLILETGFGISGSRLKKNEATVLRAAPKLQAENKNSQNFSIIQS